MAYNTVLQQGTFESDGAIEILSIRSDVDWIKVYNHTNWAGGAVANQAVDFYWQRGFADNTALMMYYDAAPVLLTALGGAGGLTNSAGISLITDLNAPLISGSETTSNISQATQPVVTTGSTTGLQVGDTVRVAYVSDNLHAANFYDFTISAFTADTNFTQAFDLATLPTQDGDNGVWRKIDRNSPWYPRTRSIINIERSSTGTVPAGRTRIHFSVTHDYTVGQQLRIHLVRQQSNNNIFGMTDIDGLVGNITEANTPVTATSTSNWVEVDIDSSTFDAFTTPATSALAGNVQIWPYVNPLGEDTATALAATPQANILGGATDNQGILGVSLNLGVSDALSPCGTDGDIMYWVAGKSFNV